MDYLVQYLSEGNHPVTVGGPNPSLETFRDGIQDGQYVLMKFTQTRGGTELGIQVDPYATDRCQISSEQGENCIHIEGTLFKVNVPAAICSSGRD